MNDNHEDQSSGKGQKRARARIEKVDAAKPVLEKSWVTVLKAFNPLGAIASAYAETLAYRIEIRRLEVEEKRVAHQAEVLHHAIDAASKLKMEELEHRRIFIERYFDTVQLHLHNIHIERMEVLKMAQIAQAEMLKPELSLEEKQLHGLMITSLTATLPQLGEVANKSLAQLVQALPPVNISPNLLPPGE